MVGAKKVKCKGKIRVKTVRVIGEIRESKDFTAATRINLFLGQILRVGFENQWMTSRASIYDCFEETTAV